MTPPDSARIDRYLWAVRVVKTRSQANALVRAGHVQIDGRPAKPASLVTAGARLRVRRGGIERDLEVVRAIDKRVGAAVAAGCVIDHTPPPPPREARSVDGVRDAGSGRPTKRDRRRIDRFRGRSGR